MIEVPPVAERSAQPSPASAADFEAFYLVHRARLFRALVVVTRDVHAAEEVAQDAFVRIWERWARVGRMDDPTGYLYRTALNGWFQVHRRAVRAARRVMAPGHVIDPLETVEDRDVLARRLLELPARQRAALVLTEYLGHDSAEAGRTLGYGRERSDGWRRKGGQRCAATTRREKRHERRAGGDRPDGSALRLARRGFRRLAPTPEPIPKAATDRGGSVRPDGCHWRVPPGHSGVPGLEARAAPPNQGRGHVAGHVPRHAGGGNAGAELPDPVGRQPTSGGPLVHLRSCWVLGECLRDVRDRGAVAPALVERRDKIPGRVAPPPWPPTGPDLQFVPAGPGPMVRIASVAGSQANGDCSFRTEFTVPDVAPGTYQVLWAFGAANSPLGESAYALFTSGPIMFEVTG